MAEFIVYADQLWKPLTQYDFIGEPEEFYLDPGRYLIIANGAAGGGHAHPGGSVYGILNLDHRQKFYAVVGGTGGNEKPPEQPHGGYNGGGKGGAAPGEVRLYYLKNPERYDPDNPEYKDEPVRKNYDDSGTGGGGATDIRIATNPEYNVPVISNHLSSDYDELSYIAANKTQCIDLQYHTTPNTRVELEISSNGEDRTSDPNSEDVFGTYDDSSNRLVLSLHKGGSNNTNMYLQIGGTEKSASKPTDNIKLTIAINNTYAEFRKGNDNVDRTMSYDVSYTPPNSECTLSVFGSKRESGITNKSSVNLYSLKIFENERMSRWFIPYQTKPSETETPIDISGVTFNDGMIKKTDGITIDTSSSTIRKKYIYTETYIPFDVTNNRVRLHIDAGTKDLSAYVFFYDSNQNFLGETYFKNLPFSRMYGESIGDLYISSPYANTAYMRFNVYNDTSLYYSDITSFTMSDIHYDSELVQGLYDLVQNKYYPSTTGDTMFACGPKTNRTTYKSSVYNTNYIMTVFRRNRSNNANLQMDYLLFYDENNNEIQVDSATATFSNGTTPTFSGPLENLYVNDQNKMCMSGWSNTGNDVYITYTLHETINSRIIDHYVIETADDYNSRDPIDWDIFVSPDGVTWQYLDRRCNAPIPTTRHEPTSFNVTVDGPSHPIDIGLYTRIIVACGSGGISALANFGDGYTGNISGGSVGSWSALDKGDYTHWTIDNRVDVEHDLGLMPDQTSGYSFGKGANALNRTRQAWFQDKHHEIRTSNGFGSGGGGGGWFGGYSSKGENEDGYGIQTGFIIDKYKWRPVIIVPDEHGGYVPPFEAGKYYAEYHVWRSVIRNGVGWGTSITDAWAVDEVPDQDLPPTIAGSGSSYVLTESSYKPKYYFASYEDLMPSLYFTNILMVPDGAIEGASIKIFRGLHEHELLDPGDTITVPYTGEKQSFALTKGEYKITCWGGCTPGNGGYSEGVLNINNDTTLYGYVGSSDWIARLNGPTALKDRMTDNKLIFNAAASNYYNFGKEGQTVGGGATDVRIGSDSLYSRILVAGGAGGGYGGGPGGGFTGGDPKNPSENCLNNGGGTQTYTPTQNRSHGDFGEGGSQSKTGENIGPAGGNGWYGGNGTYVTVSETIFNITGGSGGSSYCCNEYSYKPPGYLVDEKYYLSETYTETGGNKGWDTPRRVYTCIDIEVREIGITCIVICQDSEGYKVYDIVTNTWHLEPAITQLDIDTFNTYGVEITDIISDEGLDDVYKVYGFDKHDTGMIRDIKLNVLPNELHVYTNEFTTAEILEQTYDADQDDETEIFVRYDVKGMGEDRRAMIDITCDMAEVPITPNILYTIQFRIREKPDSYWYPVKPEKTIDDLDLLKVSSGFNIPRKYKMYMHGDIGKSSSDPDTKVAVESVQSTAAVEYKRNIYIAAYVNKYWLRFSRFNIIDNVYETICDIPASEFYSGSAPGPLGGCLLVNDENMFYSQSNDGNQIKILRIPFRSGPYQIHRAPGGDSDYYGSAYGKMEWLNDREIIMLGQKGFIKFNTRSYNFQAYRQYTSVWKANNFFIGKYGIYAFPKSSTTTTIRAFNKETLDYESSKNIIVAEGTERIVGCNGQGNKIYIIRTGALNIYTESLDQPPHLEESIPTPFISYYPMDAIYVNGVIYITISGESLLYMFDIATKRFYMFNLPFAQGDNLSDYCPQHYRPYGFKSFCFIAEMKMMTINYRKFEKYRVGQKSNYLLIKTNTTHPNPWQYDSRFVDVKLDGIHFHTGDIRYPMSLYDEENRVYVTTNDVNKSDYRKLLQMKCEKSE